MKYYLVGYTYSGKTTYGQQLALERGFDFLDIDKAIEQKYHYTISDLFRQFGEQVFRQLETQILRSTQQLDNIVIATGGGAPCHSDNMDFLLQNGRVIYLKMSPEELFIRATRSHNPRPMMRGLSKEEIKQKIISDLCIREPHYLRAHQIINAALLSHSTSEQHTEQTKAQ